MSIAENSSVPAKCRGFPKAYILCEGIPATLLPTALNNFKAHFPSLKANILARRSSDEIGARGKKSGSAARREGTKTEKETTDGWNTPRGIFRRQSADSTPW